MSDADDLGDFFAEINQIEETVATNETEQYISIDQVKQTQHIVSKLAKVIVSSAPVLHASSHPVYTYDFGDLANQDPLEKEDSLAEVTNQIPAYDHAQISNLAHYTSICSSSSSSSSSNYMQQHIPRPPVPSVPVALPSVPRQNKTFVRTGAGEVWIDESLQEWPENDYRIFVGDLAKEVTTEHLAKHFQQYKSFAKAKVIRTKHESKARGYGFVSFIDPMDCAKAIREQNGKYLLTRPMKITKSSWKERDIKEVKKKENKKRKVQESLGLA